jgi:glycosyltransferase involved in cell wall biosynthesis
MNILHLTFENIQDVPGLLSRSHRFFGDSGVLCTMTRSSLGFPNGIVLDYPLLNSPLVRTMRKIAGKDNVQVLEHELKLKIKGQRPIRKMYYHMRDYLWLYKVHRNWQRHALSGFDIYHFDGDIPFIYGPRILDKLKNKRIVTHFFGSDLRKFGANPYVRERADLKITSELDHPQIDPALFFVPIPFEADRIQPRTRENRVLRVGHSPTRRNIKGTQHLIEAVEKLRPKINFEFVLIEGVSNKRCMELKRACDIGFDQVGNYAGTGYGRSSLEFIALGIPTITEIPDRYERLLPDHPFVKATTDNLVDVLHELLTNAELRQRKRAQGLAWVRDFCHPRRIMAEIYGQYKRLGWTE